MYTEAELEQRKAERIAAYAEEKRKFELRILTAMVGQDEFTNWDVWRIYHGNWSAMANLVRSWWIDGLTERLGRDGQWYAFRPEFLPLRRNKRLWTHEARYRWIDDPQA